MNAQELKRWREFDQHLRNRTKDPNRKTIKIPITREAIDRKMKEAAEMGYDKWMGMEDD